MHLRDTSRARGGDLRAREVLMVRAGDSDGIEDEGEDEDDVVAPKVRVFARGLHGRVASRARGGVLRAREVLAGCTGLLLRQRCFGGRRSCMGWLERIRWRG